MAKLNLKNAEFNLHNALFRENYKDNSLKLTLIGFFLPIFILHSSKNQDRFSNLKQHLKVQVTTILQRLYIETLKTL